MKPIIVKTSMGDIIAFEATDPAYPGIFLDFVPKGAEVSVPVAVLEKTGNGIKDVVRLLVWTKDNEDYDEEFIIETEKKEGKL